MTTSRTKRAMENKKAPRTPGWLTGGLSICLIASVIWLACYGLFQNRVEQIRQEWENPLVSQFTTDWLMRNTYVLYRDLRQKGSFAPISYRRLYIRPEEGCEWVLDESLMQRWQQGMISAEDAAEQDLPSECGRAYSYLEMFDLYFADMESDFPELNATFGYICEDSVTGERVSNLDERLVKENDWYYYLIFIFDEYGNCTVESAGCGDGENASSDLHRTAGLSARQIRLENEDFYVERNQAEGSRLDAYLAVGAPANCRVAYCISQTEWEKIRQSGAIRIHGYLYGTDGGILYSYWRIGAENILVALWMLVLAASLFVPLSLPDGEPGEETKRPFHRSLEFLAVLGWFGFWGPGGAFGLWMMSCILSGRTEAALRQYFAAMGKTMAGSMGSLGILVPIYVVNCLLIAAIFFVTAWYVGLNLREARRIGIRAYIRKRSVIYWIFPYIKSKVAGIYNSFVHFDVSKKANRMILKLLLVNGVVLFIISTLWVMGLPVVLVYSAFLYVVLRRYISDLQKKYQVLLRATNEIAQGNLNGQIKEDLGVFEPFKPQIQRIQQGFRNAVDEEVKSQRMKAELITNVSHDLKTPLTAIITYIDLLKDEQITEQQRREYLDTLERKSLRLKALIEDLFEISRADSHNMNLHIVEVDIVNLLKQVAFEMSDKLAERDLDLRMILPDEKVLLPLDSQRTYRIYENLFGNIAKYAMPGTRVYVNAFLQADGVTVVMKNITEQEIHMNPSELTERFVRGDSSRNTEGSGLGLAIAKSFAQLQGGTLAIEVDGDLFKAITAWKF